MARKLKNIRVREVSLVDEAANNWKFVIVKRRNPNWEKKMLEKLIAKFVEDSNEEDIVKSVKALSDEQRQALEKSLTMIDLWIEDLPSDVVAAIKSLTGMAGLNKVADPKPEETEEIDLDALVEKIGKKCQEKTDACLSKVLEAVNSLADSLKSLLRKRSRR